MKQSLKTGVTTHPTSQNLGERSDLSAGWAKNRIKKVPLHQYVSIFHSVFRPRCAKYGRSLIRSEQLQTGLIGLFICINAAYAVNPTPGFYTGIIVGGSYEPKSKFTFTNPTTLTTNTGYMTYSGYGNIGGQFGYRIEQFRVEIEPLLNYNPYNKLTSGSTTYLSPQTSTGIRLKGSTTTVAIMLNALYDVYLPGGSTGFAPYLGLGIGYAHVRNSLQFYNNLAVLGTKVSTSTNTAAAQGILGAGYFLDDFTWFGLDYRYITTKNIALLNTRLQVHTINISFNGSICL